jgi:hypothetical protein
MYTRLNRALLSSLLCVSLFERNEGMARGGGDGERVGARGLTGFEAAATVVELFFAGLPSSSESEPDDEESSLSESSLELSESDEEDEEDELEESEEVDDPDEVVSPSTSILTALPLAALFAAGAASSSELESPESLESLSDEDESVGEYDSCLLLRFLAGFPLLAVDAGAIGVTSG